MIRLYVWHILFDMFNKRTANILPPPTDSNDETISPHKLLLTERQASTLCKAFVNNSSAYTKLSKSKLSKIFQSKEYLGGLLEPLMNFGLSLMKNVLSQTCFDTTWTVSGRGRNS